MREYPLCEQLSFFAHAIASTAHRAAQRYAPLPSVSTEASSKFWPGYCGVDNHDALTDAELPPPAAVSFEGPIVLPRLLAVMRELRREAGLRTSDGIAISGPVCPTANPGRVALPARYVVALQTGGPYARYPLRGGLFKAPSVPPKLRFWGNSRPASTDGGDAGDAPAGALKKKLREYPKCEQVSFDLRAIASTSRRSAPRDTRPCLLSRRMRRRSSGRDAAAAVTMKR